MTEDEFWKIIESGGSPDVCNPDAQCANIAQVLSLKSKDELFSFANLHKDILCRAYTWSMIKANYIILHYVSDDVFEDFRNWVILNGKDRYYKTIDNPDYLDTYLDLDDPIEELSGEPLLYVCESAFDGDNEELEEHYIYPDDPVIEDNWPPKERLAEEFPNLYKRYWDDSAIDYEHGG